MPKSEKTPSKKEPVAKIAKKSPSLSMPESKEVPAKHEQFHDHESKHPHTHDHKDEASHSHKVEKVVRGFGKAPSNFAKAGIAALVLLVVLTGTLAAGLVVWTSYYPQYAYYNMYAAVKNKNFDQFSKYLDLDSMARNVASEQSFYLQGKQTDEDQIRIQLKGQIEYTFLKMLNEGSLDEVMPAKPANLWDAYRNSSFTKAGSKYEINFGKSSRTDILEGVSGYKTAVLQNENGRWVIVELKNNPTLEQEKQQYQQQQSAAQSSGTPTTSATTTTQPGQ